MRWCLLCLATIGIVALGLCFVPRPPLRSWGAASFVQTTIYSSEGCAPCRRYVDAVKREMRPDGWVVCDDSDKDRATANIVIRRATAADRITAFPTTIIRRDGREVDRIEGEITPTQLAERINKHASATP